MGKRLEEALLDLRLGDHICYIYETKEQMDAIAPFILQGLEKNQQCIYIADDNSVAAVKLALEKRDVDVSAFVSSGKLNIMTKVESYVREGYFDPDRMIDLLRKSMEIAIGKGYEGLRVTGEMTWALGKQRGGERLIEYEAKLNYFFPRNSALAVCQYNATRFPPEVLLDVIKVHPLVIYGDFVCRNFYYVPPDEFLREEKQAKNELDRCLRYILEREDLDMKLREHAAQLEQKIHELNALNVLFQKYLVEHIGLQEAYASMRETIERLVRTAEVSKGEIGLSENILHPH